MVAPAPPALPAPAVVPALELPVAAAAPARTAPRVTFTPVAADSTVSVILRQQQPAHPRPSTPAAAVVDAAPVQGRRRVDRRHILSGSAIAALVLLALGLLAFTHRPTKPVAVSNPYTESVAFGYHADVPRAAAPVYPRGSLTTGDPVFLRLVHRVQVTVGYRFAARAPHRLDGTLDIVGRVSGPNGGRARSGSRRWSAVLRRPCQERRDARSARHRKPPTRWSD